MFEVDDLSYASPATISRCGMVYMDPVQLGWRPYVERWKHDLPSNVGDHIILYLFDYIRLVYCILLYIMVKLSLLNGIP